eukprot:9410737-Lingulodinium_polyedra.AAC.1
MHLNHLSRAPSELPTHAHEVLRTLAWPWQHFGALWPRELCESQVLYGRGTSIANKSAHTGAQCFP